jgi:hypothetical protein
MAQNPIISVGALNIVASPHDRPGIYSELLSAVADKEIHVWGSDRAKITAPEPLVNHPGQLYGRILVWAEIDTKGKWFNKQLNQEATERDMSAMELPPHIRPNFRSFYFVFIESIHRLVLEYRNEMGQSFGPKRAEMFFHNLFDTQLPLGSPTVDVTIIPADDTLDRIYAIPRLAKLQVFVKRPNPDDVASDADRILSRLEKQGARSQKLELVKDSNSITLTPDEDTRATAGVAAQNGYVSGEGKDNEGRRIVESTKSHPKIEHLRVGEESSFATFLTGLRSFL